MAFESGVAPEDWRSSVIVPLYKGKAKRAECYKNYKVLAISLLSVVGKRGLIGKRECDRR